MIDAMAPLTDYRDAFSRLTLYELDSMLTDAGIQKVSIGDLRDFVARIRLRAVEYADVYQTMPFREIERMLADQGLASLPIGAVRNLILRTSFLADYGDTPEVRAVRFREDYGDFHAFTLEDLIRIFEVHGMDVLSFRKLSELEALLWNFQSHGEYRDLFDVVTVADLKRTLSANELEELTFSDLGAILDYFIYTSFSDYGDRHGGPIRFLERITFAEFDRVFTNRGLGRLPIGQLETLMQEYRRHLVYEDAFESIPWRELDRTIESRNLGALNVGEVARLFGALKPLSEYEDVLEHLSMADIRSLTAIGLDAFTLADALILPELAAEQADYADVFDHLNLADLTSRIGRSGLKNMTVNQLRDTLERLRQFIHPTTSRSPHKSAERPARRRNAGSLTRNVKGEIER
jgi:hypothetical protein